jgi:N-acetylglucosaminyldiphosphoundecaprenol N-acetyl-beta-D-mannosaminyltransferase
MIAVIDDIQRLVDTIRLVHDAAAQDRLIAGLAAPERPVVAAFVNAHGFNLAWEDEAARALFLGVDMLLRDGKGLEMLCRGLGRDPGLNMNGTDLIPAVLARIGARPLAVLGSADPWLSGACTRLEADGRRIVARLDGFQPDAAYLDLIAETRPEIVVLAMGMPRQEQVAAALRAAFADRPMTILCGGAIVDFLAGRFTRAPGWTRRLGLEWAWRLMLEPRRLFRRYVIGNALFLARARLLRRRAAG